MKVDVNNYSIEKECDYKGEHYSVRDNGAIMRHHRLGKPVRPNDDKWSFGLKQYDGYMVFSGARVHIVVATAFHGVRDSSIYVVDHIDTNRCNNRPENLRWLTRLENLLKNEATRKRIIAVCGSIEAFLNDPSLFYNHETVKGYFTWMRTVTKEEAENCLKNMKEWAQKPVSKDGNGKMGEWIFESHSHDESASQFYNTRNPNVVPTRNILKNKPFEIDKVRQNFHWLNVKWSIGCTFLMCPIYSNPEEDVLQNYVKQLKRGECFMQSYNYNGILVNYRFFSEEHKIRVLCQSVQTFFEHTSGGYYVFEIYVMQNLILHEHIGSFSSEKKALACMNDLSLYGNKYRWEHPVLSRENIEKKRKRIWELTYSRAWDKVYGLPGTLSRQAREIERERYLEKIFPYIY